MPAELSQLDERYIVPMSAIGASSSVASLLDSGVSVDYVNGQGWTPLVSACFAGHKSVAAMLIERGASISQSTPHGNPLKVACRQGHVECVRLLLDAGCVPDWETLAACHPACASLVKQRCSAAGSVGQALRGLSAVVAAQELRRPAMGKVCS